MISMTMDGHWYLQISLDFVFELSPQCSVLLVISQFLKNGYFLLLFFFSFFHIFVFTFYNAHSYIPPGSGLDTGRLRMATSCSEVTAILNKSPKAPFGC